MTLRLQQLCPGKFQVRVLSQVWGMPRIDEARVLGMKPGRLAIIRQVQLLCDGHPRVYARTVIPVTSLRGKLQRLAHLGTRPLGGMLFADPGMQRGGVELARIWQGTVSLSGRHPPFASAPRGDLGTALGVQALRQAAAGQ